MPFVLFGSVVKRRYYTFCSKHGYMDNPKYLMAFYIQNREDCIWVYTSEKERLIIEKEYSSNCLKLIKKNSFRLFYYLARSKVLFVTHSIGDIGNIYLKNTLVVNLYHGVVLKKMGFDSIIDVKKFKLDEQQNPYESNDFVISSSEYSRSYLSTCMNIPKARILPYGQPRVDFLFDSMNDKRLVNKLKNDYGISNEKVYLYAPTYRDDNVGKSLEIYNEIIESFVRDADESVLILRLHPNERAALKDSFSQAKVQLSINDDPLYDLLIADAMLTDFSGILFDYAVLNRPIALYAPDISDYVLCRGGFNFDYDKIADECYVINKGNESVIWNFDLGYVKYRYLHRFQIPNASQTIYNSF